MDCHRSPEKNIVKASIDIGTNTVLLLVAEVEVDALKVIEEQQRIPRLGAGVDESQNLSGSAMQRVIKALQEYQLIVQKRYPEADQIIVTATSAVRDANNREEFLAKVAEETGLQIQVLSGFEEAQYTFFGALSVLSAEIKDSENVIIDIGGGSTEIASGKDGIRDRYSFDMGCVRFTERFFKDDPPTGDQIRGCREAIEQMLSEYSFNYFTNQSQLIGVAGTVTSLAYIDRQLDGYDSKLLSGHILSQASISKYISEFKQYSSTELENHYPKVLKGRADIFLAGLLILEVFMKKYNFKKLVTSTGGIRHGSLLIGGRN